LDALILRSSPNSLSAVRSLGRAGLEVAVAARDSDPAVKTSRYVSRFERLDDIDDRAVEQLLDLPRGNCKPFLLATGDQDALLVAKHQERLRTKFCFVVPSHVALEAIIDKSRLYSTAQAHGVPHPKFHVVREAMDVEAAIATVGTPCYVKPSLAHEWRRVRRGKLVRADTPDELRRVLHSFVGMNHAAIPIEIIPGLDSEVFSVSTYIDSHGSPVGFRTKRKLRQYPVDAGDGCAQEICHEPAVAELGLGLLGILGHRGPATVEFRRDARNDRFVLMEVNARTILGQEMITRSGFDVPLIAYHDAKGLPLPASRKPAAVRWVAFGQDFRAFRELRRRRLITARNWIRSLLACRSFAYFSFDDPRPFFARIALWLRRRRTGTIRREEGAIL
jgi:D-aspartate ligase